MAKIHQIRKDLQEMASKKFSPDILVKLKKTLRRDQKEIESFVSFLEVRAFQDSELSHLSFFLFCLNSSHMFICHGSAFQLCCLKSSCF